VPTNYFCLIDALYYYYLIINVCINIFGFSTKSKSLYFLVKIARFP